MRSTQRSTERKLFTCKSGTSLSKSTAKSRRKRREKVRKFMGRLKARAAIPYHGAYYPWYRH